MTETPATTEEVVAAYEAERQAQAAQRVMVAQAAWNMKNRDACGLCMDGINRWLRDHGVPRIPDPEGFGTVRFNPDQALQEALRSIPALQEPELYSAIGLQRQLDERRRTGASWLTTIVRDLGALRDSYSSDIPDPQIPALIRRLRGEPELEPEPQAADTAVPASANASAARPVPGMVNVTMTAMFTLQIPAGRIAGASDGQITSTAESTIRNALTGAIQGGQHGATFVRQPEITAAVQRG